VTATPFFRNVERALVVCAHTDDEYGCAGTIARLVEGGATIRYLALSRCEESVPAGFPKDILEAECRRCAERLGIRPELVEVSRYKVRHMPEHRQEILEQLYALNRDYRPELVLLPASFDTHQDHAAVHMEGFRAFKHSSILGYELPQNLTSFTNTAFVHLEERHIEKKLHALAAYESQLSRSYAASDFVRGLARVRGVQCGAAYAEAFELVRLIV
jgi:LmbE family N-acetylglucosaminyl deacetylase